ncbi:alpha/beta fold hydrolase [Actinocatenispora rupis]
MTGVHVREWGDGDRVAVLVHGMTTDSGSYWRVGPALAARGYRVLAPDLPGHGRSERRDRYTLADLGSAVAGVTGVRPALAVRHSLGGLVLATIVDTLRPDRAVYVDPPWGVPPGPEVAAFLRTQREWPVERLAAFHPRWPPSRYPRSTRRCPAGIRAPWTSSASTRGRGRRRRPYRRSWSSATPCRWSTTPWPTDCPAKASTYGGFRAPATSSTTTTPTPSSPYSTAGSDRRSPP